MLHRSPDGRQEVALADGITLAGIWVHGERTPGLAAVSRSHCWPGGPPRCWYGNGCRSGSRW